MNCRIGAAAVGLAMATAGCGVGTTSAKTKGEASHATTSLPSGVTTTISHSGSALAGTTPSTVPESMLPSGQSGTRANVPWSLIGPGWFLATWSAAAPSAATPPPATVFMVDPQGGRYSIGTAPAGTNLSDWSGDGTHAVFVSDAGATTASIYIMDLQTGGTSNFQGQSGNFSPAVQFTRPDGLAVIVGGAGSQSGAVPTERYGLSGAMQQSYPTSYPQAGTAYGSFAESPDGTQLVLATTNGVELVSNSGQPLGFIPPPPGQESCGLVRWWGGADILVNCGTQLWLQPVSGAALTPGQTVSDPGTAITNPANQETYVGAWQLPSGYYVEGAACGTTWLDKVNTDGTTTRLNPPGASGSDSVSALGAYDSKLAIEITPSCDEGQNSGPKSNTLGFYDPVANVVTPLLGAGANGGWIDTAVLYKNGVLD